MGDGRWEVPRVEFSYKTNPRESCGNRDSTEIPQVIFKDEETNVRMETWRQVINPMTDPAGAGRLMLTWLSWLGYIDGIHGTPYR